MVFDLFTTNLYTDSFQYKSNHRLRRQCHQKSNDRIQYCISAGADGIWIANRKHHAQSSNDDGYNRRNAQNYGDDLHGFGDQAVGAKERISTICLVVVADGCPSLLYCKIAILAGLIEHINSPGAKRHQKLKTNSKKC